MRSYQAARTGMLRGAAYPDVRLPPWPDLTAPSADAAGLTGWLREVWSIAEIADAVEAASPEFADTVRRLCAGGSPGSRESRRVIVTMTRYVQRMRGRCTPAGLMAGVALVRFGPAASVRWTGNHRAIARAGAEWLAAVITLIERCPALLDRLPGVANSALVPCGDRLVVPHRLAGPGPQAVAADISVRRTAPVELALAAASAPVLLGDIAAKVRAEFPETAPSVISSMLAGLVECGVLITSLHAPSTQPDGLAHLITELEAASGETTDGPAWLNSTLTEVSRLLQRHNTAPSGQARKIRSQAAALMRTVARTRQHPLAIDQQLGADIVLPDAVAREAERAALVLTRLAVHPAGTPAWRAYHQRFYERYGLGSLVPVVDMVSDSGIGWPDGYPGAPQAERARLSRRDERLLALAQETVLDGRDELVLGEAEVSALESGPGPRRPPPHLELGVRVHAADAADLRRGDFRLHLVTVSRGAGVLTGRFLPVLGPADRAILAGELAGVPCSDQDTLAVQLSFPPLNPATAHVARVPQIFADVITLGEHHPPGNPALTVADLAVGCDGRRMYLAVPGRGTRVEAVAVHALNLIRHTPPLARLLIELSRAQCAQVTMFDWGTAACLPFLPRVRAGRAVLSPARWRLASLSLPGRQASWREWADALAAWLEQRHVPRLVHLTEGDQRLPLDLAEDAHRAVLRAHLASTPYAVLSEAPGVLELGWCGGRPHEIIIPVCAIQPPHWPELPAPVTSRVLSRGHGQFPGTSRVLLASLYGDIARQDDILTGYLPGLLAELPPPARWWYIRYRDRTGQHIRLRIKLPELDAFGPAARTISTWAGTLRTAGLLREVRYPADYPETGRWGSGLAWAAAEAVFEADSAAMLTQLAFPGRPAGRPLAAAHAVSIAVAFTGGPEAGMRWLADHVPAAAPARVPRPVLDQARRLADAAGGWAALKSEPGGQAIVGAWADRDRAVSAYRAHLPGPDMAGICGDDVLSSLLHVNYVRGHGIDFAEEAACMYLARAAAVTWLARKDTGSCRDTGQ